jgi:hypothetical protein
MFLSCLLDIIIINNKIFTTILIIKVIVLQATLLVPLVHYLIYYLNINKE